MNESKAVLWDMDGTLINSGELHWIAWRTTMGNEGIALTRDQFLDTFGQRNDTILAKWLGPAVTPETIQRIGNAKEELYRTLVRHNGVLPEPGVATWLHRLHTQGWKQAIASAAPRANIDAILGALKAAHIFQGIVSAEDVHQGKPDPEVYLVAASRLGVPPQRCIVVEDAAAGIEGAQHAGMHSIGVDHNGKALKADVVVSSLDQLTADAFEQLLKENGRLSGQTADRQA